MKNIIFLLLVFNAAIFTGSYAQSTIGDKYTGKIDSMLATANISKQEINTGILYARAIPLAALHRFNQNDTVNRSYFLQAARELRNAAYDKKHHRETKELRNIADRYTYRDNLTPLGVLFSEFTHIDTLSGEKGYIELDSDGELQFTDILKSDGLVDKKVLISATLCSKREISSDASFILPKELITGNKAGDIRSAEIDFGDDAGFRKFNLVGKKIINTQIIHHIYSQNALIS